MAKAQTFGDKVAKAQTRQQKKCPVCDTPLSYVKLISPMKTASGSFRFRSRIAKLCKCTEGELKGI